MRWSGRRMALGVGVLLAAVPATAQASPVLRVTDGKARVVNDRLLPPQARTALPAVPRGTTTIARTARRARVAALTPTQRASYDSALRDASAVRDGLTGARRDELSAVIATAQGIEARGELTLS